jgi:LysM repeat protein
MESHSQQPSAGAVDSADDDRWLTYLNYDQSIQQAVRRLGALSSANVDEFRSLLLKGRDRSRVKDYEAESIRRLQGEAFVGDEDLQRALIVLNAEDPRLGDELKRIVATSGKPGELDKAVAAIQLQKEMLNRPGQVRPRVQPREKPRRPQPAPLAATRPQTQPAPRSSWAKRLAIPGAIAALAAVGLLMFLPRPATENAQKAVNSQPASVPLRPSTSEDVQPVPAPGPVAAPPAQSPVQSEARAAEPNKASLEKQAPSSNTPPTPTPMPGASYRVVRGDMLSAIARQAYRDASKFKLIQKANPSLHDQPDLILVDQIIYIPPAP